MYLSIKTNWSNINYKSNAPGEEVVSKMENSSQSRDFVVIPADGELSPDAEQIQFDSNEMVHMMLEDDVCRVCLYSEGMVAIFDGLGTDEQFRYCTSLQISEDDGLPNKLCHTCVEHLKIAYDFRFQATYAEKYFLKTSSVIVHECQNEVRTEHEVTIEEEKHNTNVAAAIELEENMQEIDQLLTECIADEDLELEPTIHKTDETTLKSSGSIFGGDGNTSDSDSFSNHQVEKSSVSYDYYYSNNESNQENKIGASILGNSTCSTLPKQTVIIADSNNVDCALRSKGTKEKTLKVIDIQNSDAKDTKEDKVKIECNICGTKFTHISSLKQHLMKHTGEKPFRCEFCAKCFARKTILTIHRRLHTGDRPYRCDECIRAFVTKEALNRHKVRDHGEDEAANFSKKKVSFICSICHKTRSSKFSLATHMRTQHAKDGAEFSKKAAQGKSKVVTNTRSRHPRRSARIKEKSSEATVKYCKICQAEFDSKWALVAHQETHEKLQMYECDICQRSFEKKYLLLYHLQTHENGETVIKNYVETSLESQRSQNRVSVDPEYSQCTTDEEDDKPLAERIKILRRSMRKSRRIQTRTVMTENVVSGSKSKITQSSTTQNSKIGSKRLSEATLTSNINFKCRAPRENLTAMKGNLMCQLCRRTFTHPTSLKSHMMKHSGERPFRCEHCSKCFTRHNVLNIHRRLHTGEKPYKCLLCEDAFVTKEALSRHVTKAHPQSNKSVDAEQAKQQSNSVNTENEGKETNKVLFRCNLCSEGFSNLTEYTSHLDAHAPPEIFQCNVCNVKFEKKFKLLFHMEQHKAENQSCKKCGEVFILKEELIGHVKRNHLDQRSLDYKCMSCNRGFFDMRDFKQHLFDEHEIATQGINTCDMCRLDFNSGMEYYEHIYDKHDSVNKACNECGAVFKSLQNFNEHFFSHFF